MKVHNRDTRPGPGLVETSLRNHCLDGDLKDEEELSNWKEEKTAGAKVLVQEETQNSQKTKEAGQCDGTQRKREVEAQCKQY